VEQESWRVPNVRDENHFLHAVTAGVTKDEWVHAGAFRCRWIPVLACMSVYASTALSSTAFSNGDSVPITRP